MALANEGQQSGLALGAWGGVQATMEEEARDRAEQLVIGAAGSIFDEMGVRPAITVKPGEAIDVVKVMLEEHPGIAALVLGAAAQGCDQFGGQRRFACPRRASKGGDEPPLPCDRFGSPLTDQGGNRGGCHAASVTPSGSFAPVMKATASDIECSLGSITHKRRPKR